MTTVRLDAAPPTASSTDRILPTPNAVTTRTLVATSLVVAFALAGTNTRGSDSLARSWTRITSPHFVAVSNADDQQALKILTQLEQFRSVLQNITGGTDPGSEVPTFVYIFRNEASMKPYKGGSERAYFVPTWHGNYIALNVRPATGGVVRDNPYTLFPYKDVYHEYVHFVLSNSFANVPRWLHEGLAEYYSTFWSTQKQAEVGRPIVLYVKYLDSGGPKALEWIATMPDGWQPHENATGRFYAQSWATVHYLLHAKEPRRTQFFDYFRLVTSGVPLEPAFRSAFGSSFDELEREVRLYVHSRSLSHGVLPVQPVRAGDMDVTPLSSAETKRRLGLLLLARGGDEEQVRAHFTDEDDGESPDALAFFGQGLLELASGDNEAAIDRLEKAVATRDNDPLMYLALGKARLARSEQLHFAQDENGKALLGAARMAFRRSLELENDLTAAALGLGRTYVVDEPYRSDAEDLLKLAWKRRPANTEIPITLALMAFRKGDRAGAEKVMAHASSLSPRPLTDRLVTEAVRLADPGVAAEAPHAAAVEQALRMVRSLRAGSGGSELAARLQAEDEAMVRSSHTVDDAIDYLEAVRTAKGTDREVVRQKLENIARDDKSLFADAAKAMLAGIE